jgi:hypothetical protein
MEFGGLVAEELPEIGCCIHVTEGSVDDDGGPRRVVPSV